MALAGREDLRVAKTKDAISRAMVQLLHEKDIHSITVQNILDRAMVNRKTFYKYFRDKYDLVEQMADGLIKKIFANADSATILDQLKILDSHGLDLIYKSYYDNKDLILALWDVRTENLDFFKLLQTLFQEYFFEFIDFEPGDSKDLAFVSFIFSTLLLNSLKYILESGKVYSGAMVRSEIINFYRILLKNPTGKKPSQRKV